MNGVHERQGECTEAERRQCRRGAVAAQAQGPGSAEGDALRPASRRPVVAWAMLCALESKRSFARLGISQHAMLSANGSRGHSFKRDEGKTTCLSGADAQGASVTLARGRGRSSGFVRIPGTWEWCPETCAACLGQGLRGGCWWEAKNRFWLLVGPLPMECHLKHEPETWLSGWLVPHAALHALMKPKGGQISGG